MIPLYDDNQTRHVAYATYWLIGLNAGAFALLQGLSFEPMLTHSLCRWGLIPGELLGTIPAGSTIQLGQVLCTTGDLWTYLTPITSMFMHGGWFHIIGNLWFLHVFGDNVEDAMGWKRFVIFYLICGLAAAAAQVASNPTSPIPMVGASGAIGGVMGAYARLYPHARVHTLIFLGFLITRASIPAVIMLGYWFVIQVVGGIPSLASNHGGIAFWAHVGGFVMGLILVKPFSRQGDHKRQENAFIKFRRPER